MPIDATPVDAGQIKAKNRAIDCLDFSLQTLFMTHVLSATDPAALLAAVLKVNEGTTNSRLRDVLASAIRHLHSFALDIDLTPEELQVGLDFMVEVGRATGPEKHEGILLADILGLATLVQLRAARDAVAAGGTEPALVGPFWRAHQPLRPSGSIISSSDTPGPRLRVYGRVTDLKGMPLIGARVETWQASPKGFYENQDESQCDMNLRARFETDAEGRFWFESVRPAGYPVPTDGPCGALLAAQRRSVMRPAHLHFIVAAEGHKVLATQFFDEEDPHVYEDAVFGAVGSLVRRFEPDGDGYRLDLELKLERGETRLPHAPLP